jgi:hypothetical protein
VKVTTRMRLGSILFALVCLLILGMVFACTPDDTGAPQDPAVSVDIDRSKPRPKMQQPKPAKPAPRRK